MIECGILVDQEVLESCKRGEFRCDIFRDESRSPKDEEGFPAGVRPLRGLFHGDARSDVDRRLYGQEHGMADHVPHILLPCTLLVGYLPVPFPCLEL